MKKKLGYLGIMIFITTSILDKKFNFNDVLSSILMFCSFIMFVPMLIEELRSAKKK